MRFLTGLTVSLALFFCASSSLAADDPGLAAARAQAKAGLGDNCDIDVNGSEYFQDNVYHLRWKDTSYDPAGETREGTLYEVFCMAGAYNVVMAYLFAYKDSPASLLAFATPEFDYAYADDDETMTKLAREPEMTGFSAEITLVNPEFDPETMTLSSFNKWRGLGDAWSSGVWMFDNGRFTLQEFSVDPTYEANLDDPTSEQMDKFYTLYKRGN